MSGSGFAKMYLVLLLLIVLPTLSYSITPWLHTQGNQFQDPNNNTVILRGVSMIDIGATQQWYGGVNALVDRLTNTSDPAGSSPGWYTRIIRLACYPPDEGFTSPFGWQPGSNDFYNNLLRPLVDYCKTKDLYVIIDWHYISDTWTRDQMTRDFWTYMAPRFANDSNVLFEVFNEPINSGSTETQRWIDFRDDVQPWVNIIRSYAANNIILVGGPSWSQIIGPAATYPVSGSNIAYVAHVYPIHWLDSGTRAWIQNHITTCHAVYPVMLTEWGFSSSSCDDITCGTIANFGQPLKDFIQANGLSWTAWCANYEWLPPMYYSGYTLRVGSGEMGGFTKDWLYEKRNDNQPGGGGTQAPYGGAAWAVPGKMEAENYDTGGEGVAYHDSDSANSGGAYRSDGVDIESTTDTGGGYNVGWIITGEWLEYTVNVATAGTYNVEVRVAAPSTGGTLHIEFGSVNKTGTMTVPQTGGWQTWTTVTKTGVSLAAGQQVMRVAMDAGNFNLNWVNIATAAPTNLLLNPGFESGTTSWAGQGCTISRVTTKHSGSYGVRTSSRTAAWAGPVQIITSALAASGQGNYQLSAWMKMFSGSATGKVSMRLTHGGGTTYFGVTGSATTSWKQISGVVNLTWSGTLTEAAFYIETTSGTTNFYADDCSIVKSLSKMAADFALMPDVVKAVPEQFILHQNYPNPFNPQTSISYELPASGLVRLDVYDMLGREALVLVNEVQEAGMHTVVLNMEDRQSGMYLYRMTCGSFTDVKKLLFVK
ncbi:MAG: carbohydrate-binding protein [Calditrichaeota bacterium]|nr:MAG: carbohydrate-binding protein [Calditrichota bacterium]